MLSSSLRSLCCIKTLDSCITQNYIRNFRHLYGFCTTIIISNSITTDEKPNKVSCSTFARLDWKWNYEHNQYKRSYSLFAVMMTVMMTASINQLNEVIVNLL